MASFLKKSNKNLQLSAHFHHKNPNVDLLKIQKISSFQHIFTGDRRDRPNHRKKWSSVREGADRNPPFFLRAFASAQIVWYNIYLHTKKLAMNFNRLTLYIAAVVLLVGGLDEPSLESSSIAEYRIKIPTKELFTDGASSISLYVPGDATGLYAQSQCVSDMLWKVCASQHMTFILSPECHKEELIIKLLLGSSDVEPHHEKPIEYVDAHVQKILKAPSTPKGNVGCSNLATLPISPSESKTFPEELTGSRLLSEAPKRNRNIHARRICRLGEHKKTAEDVFVWSLHVLGDGPSLLHNPFMPTNNTIAHLPTPEYYTQTLSPMFGIDMRVSPITRNISEKVVRVSGPKEGIACYCNYNVECHGRRDAVRKAKLRDPILHRAHRLPASNQSYASSQVQSNATTPFRTNQTIFLLWVMIGASVICLALATYFYVKPQSTIMRDTREARELLSRLNR